MPDEGKTVKLMPCISGHPSLHSFVWSLNTIYEGMLKKFFKWYLFQSPGLRYTLILTGDAFPPNSFYMVSKF